MQVREMPVREMLVGASRSPLVKIHALIKLHLSNVVQFIALLANDDVYTKAMEASKQKAKYIINALWSKGPSRGCKGGWSLGWFAAFQSI